MNYITLLTVEYVKWNYYPYFKSNNNCKNIAEKIIPCVCGWVCEFARAIESSVYVCDNAHTHTHAEWMRALVKLCTPIITFDWHSRRKRRRTLRILYTACTLIQRNTQHHKLRLTLLTVRWQCPLFDNVITHSIKLLFTYTFCYTRTLIISVILYENWSQTNNNSHKLMIYQHTWSSRRKNEEANTQIYTYTQRTKRMAFKFYRHFAV